MFAPLIADISFWFAAPPRHRRGHLCERQLPRGHDLAAGRAALHRNRRLACDPHRHRRSSCLVPMLPLDAGAAPAGAAAGVDAALGRGAGARLATAATAARHFARGAADAARRSPAWPVAWRCRCRRSTSSRTARDLGYGAARGAEMLSLMLGFGIISRLAFGCDLPIASAGCATLADRIGAARRRAAAVPSVRRAGVAVRDLGVVRPVPGRHRAVVRDDHARVLFAEGGRRARRHRV